MKEHPHATVLREIADGVPLSEFEVLRDSWAITSWTDAHGYTEWAFSAPHRWQIRRKPQQIMVNGFKVPKPLDVVPGFDVYSPDLMSDDLFTNWNHPDNRSKAVQRGIAHATNEAAIAHAKAILGIDPNAP